MAVLTLSGLGIFKSIFVFGLSNELLNMIVILQLLSTLSLNSVNFSSDVDVFHLHLCSYFNAKPSTALVWKCVSHSIMTNLSWLLFLHVFIKFAPSDMNFR